MNEKLWVGFTKPENYKVESTAVLLLDENYKKLNSSEQMKLPVINYSELTYIHLCADIDDYLILLLLQQKNILLNCPDCWFNESNYKTFDIEELPREGVMRDIKIFIEEKNYYLSIHWGTLFDKLRQFAEDEAKAEITHHKFMNPIFFFHIYDDWETVEMTTVKYEIGTTGKLQNFNFIRASSYEDAYKYVRSIGETLKYPRCEVEDLLISLLSGVAEEPVKPSILKRSESVEIKKVERLANRKEFLKRTGLTIDYYFSYVLDYNRIYGKDK